MCCAYDTYAHYDILKYTHTQLNFRRGATCHCIKLFHATSTVLCVLYHPETQKKGAAFGLDFNNDDREGALEAGAEDEGHQTGQVLYGASAKIQPAPL